MSRDQVSHQSVLRTYDFKGVLSKYVVSILGVAFVKIEELYIYQNIRSEGYEVYSWISFLKNHLHLETFPAHCICTLNWYSICASCHN